jgi:hypothetical protein
MMSAALQELRDRLDEIKVDLTFVALAFQLRPRIAGVVRFELGGEVVDLVKKFKDAKTVRPEGIYGSLLVRLLASLERYLRKVVGEAIADKNKAAPNYTTIGDTLGKRNIALTGRLLGNIESPPDHIAVDFTSLIQNLASCVNDGGKVVLNPEAFSATVSVPTPGVIDKALSHIGVKSFWDDLGNSSQLQKALGTKKSRDTKNQAQDRLAEICRWRNHLAHGGDAETALTETELREAIDFISAFAEALDSVVMDA